jgi:hypothetical protein
LELLSAIAGSASDTPMSPEIHPLRVGVRFTSLLVKGQTSTLEIDVQNLLEVPIALIELEVVSSGFETVQWQEKDFRGWGSRKALVEFRLTASGDFIVWLHARVRTAENERYEGRGQPN